MLIHGLDLPTTDITSQSRLPETRNLGQKLAEVWLNSNFAAWEKSGVLYEKYDADHLGHGGGGGEYVPQNGFGWTNGVILDLIGRYPDSSE